MLTTLKQAIDDTEEIASNIKETICDMLGERGKVNDILLYNYAVHINLDACPSDQRPYAQEIIESAYRQDLRKIRIDKQYAVSKEKPAPELRIEELPQKYKPLPHTENVSPGIWYIAHGSKTDLPIKALIYEWRALR